MRLTVYGKPIPQGSKDVRKRGDRVWLVESQGVSLKEWRLAIANAAREWLAKNGGPAPIDGPVDLTATFYLARPKSAPKHVRFPAKAPDLDKLTRSVGDSLTGIAYTDDSRIVDIHVRKRFAIDSPPRVELFLREMHADDAA